MIWFLARRKVTKRQVKRIELVPEPSPEAVCGKQRQGLGGSPLQANRVEWALTNSPCGNLRASRGPGPVGTIIMRLGRERVLSSITEQTSGKTHYVHYLI